MKKISILLLAFMPGAGQLAFGQCATGYTSSQLNWDNLDYYFNSANSAPYGSYISDALEQTQKFALGTTAVTMVASNNSFVIGENGTHTGNLTNFTGEDAQFTPSANGQTLTLSFASEITNATFTLYDVDDDAQIDFRSTNAANVQQAIDLTLQGSTTLTRFSNGTTSPYVVANGTALGNSSNEGAVTVSVAGPAKQIIITVTTRGNNPTFWLSDINACVPGSFPTSYHQASASKPFTGQPDYFIATPDNNSAYMVDPATGRAWHLFTETASTYINSFGYDAVNHILYYVTDGTGSAGTNKQIKKYDFNTETISVVVSDIVTGLGIPTFNQGVESAGACFYDGALYFGIEGGRQSTSTTRETIVWKIAFSAGLVPAAAYQVFAKPAYNTANSESIHDWGDFYIKDGVLYDFNTARNGNSPFNYSASSIIHFNMLNSTEVIYANPSSSTVYAGQTGMDWAGSLYSVSNVVRKYNLDGTFGTSYPLTAVAGPAWVGSAGDASEPFRPKLDFGDAPATYDPVAGDPAVHGMDTAMRLGASFTKEWSKTGATTAADADTDNGVASLQIFCPCAGNYLAYTDVWNNTGADATVAAWLDFNGNGVFDEAEGISVTVRSKAEMQNIALFWPSAPTSLSKNSYTYMRIRLTSATNNLTTSRHVGYVSNGEVEDYRVLVDDYPLSVQLKDFSAVLTAQKNTVVQWNISDQSNIALYILERSNDNRSWQTIASQGVLINSHSYSLTDNHPLAGTSYYRLKLVNQDAATNLSKTKRIDNVIAGFSFSISPNPATEKAFVKIKSAAFKEKASLKLLTAQGAPVYNTQLFLETGETLIYLPVEKLRAGTYLVQISTPNGTVSQRLVLAK